MMVNIIAVIHLFRVLLNLYRFFMAILYGATLGVPETYLSLLLQSSNNLALGLSTESPKEKG